jgi:hypothetical protein
MVRLAMWLKADLFFYHKISQTTFDPDFYGKAHQMTLTRRNHVAKCHCWQINVWVTCRSQKIGTENCIGQKRVELKSYSRRAQQRYGAVVIYRPDTGLLPEFVMYDSVFQLLPACCVVLEYSFRLKRTNNNLRDKSSLTKSQHIGFQHCTNLVIKTHFKNSLVWLYQQIYL